MYITYSEFKNMVKNGKMGYEGIGVCDLCNRDISGCKDDIIYRLRIQEDDLYEPRNIVHKNLCGRCYKVLVGFMDTIKE